MRSFSLFTGMFTLRIETLFTSTWYYTSYSTFSAIGRCTFRTKALLFVFIVLSDSTKFRIVVVVRAMRAMRAMRGAASKSDLYNQGVICIVRTILISRTDPQLIFKNQYIVRTILISRTDPQLIFKNKYIVRTILISRTDPQLIFKNIFSHPTPNQPKTLLYTPL